MLMFYQFAASSPLGGTFLLARYWHHPIPDFPPYGVEPLHSHGVHATAVTTLVYGSPPFLYTLPSVITLLFNKISPCPKMLINRNGLSRYVTISPGFPALYRHYLAIGLYLFLLNAFPFVITQYKELNSASPLTSRDRNGLSHYVMPYPTLPALCHQATPFTWRPTDAVTTLVLVSFTFAILCP